MRITLGGMMAKLTGTWKTTFGTMRLTQTDDRVEGTYVMGGRRTSVIPIMPFSAKEIGQWKIHARNASRASSVVVEWPPLAMLRSVRRSHVEPRGPLTYSGLLRARKSP